MFSTLENTWDQSAHRGWSTLASFGFQALALSLLLAIPFLWTQGPPHIRFVDESVLAPPPASAPPSQAPEQQSAQSSNMSGTHILQPPSIPPAIAILNETEPPAPPDIGTIGVRGGTGPGGGAIAELIREHAAVPVAPPSPAPEHRIRISHPSEGSLIFRVQPVYPAIARQARIQGPVVLRAIISKTGTIEHLTVLSGRPMLVPAAIDAVRQWRYRPYLLNDEPIEIETEITVNFVLSGQ